jgi:hypothetical protein
MRNPAQLALVSLAAFGLLQAQGTKTRADAAQYSAHVELGSVTLAADFWGHGIPLEDGMDVKTQSYLVVEVAFFAPPSQKILLQPAQFTLKVNGQILTAQSAGLVTVGMLVPDMRERGPRVEADGQAGPATVSVGRDPTQPKFPGDNNPADIPRRLPGEAPATVTENRVDPVKAVSDAALPEGTHVAPLSGYLFFAWSGKLKHAKQVELEYKSELGTASLPLR